MRALHEKIWIERPMGVAGGSSMTIAVRYVLQPLRAPLSRPVTGGRGLSLSAGEAFAFIGVFHENGNWFHHTYIQVITAEGLAAGYMSKGYGAEKDPGRMNALCPSPIPLFINRPSRMMGQGFSADTEA